MGASRAQTLRRHSLLGSCKCAIKLPWHLCGFSKGLFLESILSVCLSDLVSIPHCLEYCSLIVSLEIRQCEFQVFFKSTGGPTRLSAEMGRLILKFVCQCNGSRKDALLSVSLSCLTVFL